MLKNLREACGPWHEKLHVHPLLASLMTDEVTVERYVNVLTAFYSVYASLETTRVPGLLDPTVPDAPVAGWLEADLSRYGETPEVLPNNATTVLDTPSKVFGYLYVKQGSTLGGQFISKHLEKTLHLRPGKDNHFFSGYGSETGAKWKEFRERLEANAPGLDVDEVVSTAVAVFKKIDEAATAVLNSKEGALHEIAR